MEFKQHTLELMGQRRHQNRNQKHLETIENETQYIKTMGCSKSSFERDVYSDKRLIKKKEWPQVNNLTLHLKELENEQTKPQVSRSKEITKIREEINKLEIRKTKEKINKIRSCFFKNNNKIDKPVARLNKKRRYK